MSAEPNENSLSEPILASSQSNQSKRVSERLANLQTTSAGVYTDAASSFTSSSTALIQTKSEDLMNEDSAQRRRSSSRSIKRKKFDDELVESTISNYPKVGKFGFLIDERPPQTPDRMTPPILQLTTPTTVAPLSMSTPQPEPTISLPQLCSKLAVARPPARAETPLGSYTKKKSRKADKNVGVNNYWKPIDDLTLICNVMQTNDLEKVYREVKFSSKFTYADIEHRWRSLLYQKSSKTLSTAAMRQLHSDVISEIELKALFSDAEEKLIMSINSRTLASLDVFEKLIEENAEVFGGRRTASKLRKHWYLLRSQQLLNDQTANLRLSTQSMMSFAEMQVQVRKEIENSIILGTLPSSQAESEAKLNEIRLNVRKCTHEIRMLENEIPKYQALVDSITLLPVTDNDFGMGTFAVLRGRSVRYLMRSYMIVIGRSSKDSFVDVDLTLEGPSMKISRKQAVISLHPTGEFLIRNTGRAVIYADSVPIIKDNSQRISHNSLLEFGSLRFLFFVNTDRINHVRADFNSS